MQTTCDISGTSRLITGERLFTKLAVHNITAVQKARALLSIKNPSKEEIVKLEGLDRWLGKQCFSRFCAAGECRHATIAYLRYLGNRGDDESLGKANSMIQKLSGYRDGNGKWKGFPFYYTLLVLAEIQTDAAKHELNYAYQASKKALKRIESDESYRKIRHDTISNALRMSFGPSSLLTEIMVDRLVI
ncbi:MAG: hypothetical protein ACFFEF_06020 [Candidatus Thorarchaeota archaeon]